MQNRENINGHILSGRIFTQEHSALIIYSQI